MFEKIIRITLDILLDIINQIKLHSHEFESFDTEEYKRSDLREVLKEEYLSFISNSSLGILNALLISPLYRYMHILYERI